MAFSTDCAPILLPALYHRGPPPGAPAHSGVALLLRAGARVKKLLACTRFTQKQDGDVWWSSTRVSPVSLPRRA
jgi:hypothetical protein